MRVVKIPITLLLLGISSALAQAEPLLNFTPQAGGTIRTNIAQGGCMANITGQTAFLLEGSCFAQPEIFTDPETGIEYFHMIVGSPGDGFIQESYIETGAVPSDPSLTTTTTLDNGHDPLGIVTGTAAGNGQANPRKMIMRQIVNDGEILMEFVKDKFLKKPLISQILTTSEVTSIFQADMRNSNYDDMNSAGSIVNTFTLLNNQGVVGNGDFDMSTDAQNAYITAGRYIYTDGTANGGTAGVYDYIDSSFDPTTVEWADYFDTTEDNPWGYSDLRPN